MAESPSFDPESGLNAALYKAIADCRDCVQKMKEDYNETGMPVTDDSTSLHRLSAKLEFLLQAHSKGRTGMMGKKKDYWDYMVRCLATRKSIHDGIKFVKACPDYKTSMGRGRALIRFCLVHNCLADTIQQCVMDGEATSAFYKPNSPLMRHEMSSDLIDTLYVLNEVRFDLNPTGHDLDVSWPTFSKMSPGNLSNWRPPSRAMSISSLDSSFSTSYENNGGLSSSLGDVDERHEPELVAYKVEVADLRTRIEELATENHALKTEKATHVCGPPPDDTDGKEHHFLEQVANLRSCLEARDVEMRTLADSNSSLKEETGSLRLQLSTQVKDYERVVAASEAAQEELARLSAAVTEQEGIIGSLEAKLAEFETDRETELDKSMRFNESLQEELAEKALIAEEMEKRVERFEVAVKSLRKSVRTVCSELSSLSSPAHRKSPMINGGTDGESECLEADEGSDVEDTEGIVGLESRIKGLVVCVQKHVVEFDADNRLLREGLVRLLKEKDKLWHHNNRLVQLFRQLMRTDLAEDESAVDCSSCGALFSLMLRRHHCRLCGKYFCYACADHYLSLAATRGRTRVCRHCFGLVQKINLDGNSSFAVDDNEEEVKEEAAKQENGVPETPSDSPEHEIRRRNRGIEETAALIVTLPRPKPRRPHEAEEENFTVITSGEIASVRAEAADCPPPVLHPSKLYEPLSIADLVQRDTSSPSPLQDESEDGNPFESYPYNVEFWVTAGNSLGVPISLPIQPCVVDWKVDVQSQMDLNFAITYRPSVDVGPTESLHKIQRLVEGSSRGQLRVKRPGLYTFVFDNTYSTLKAKKVALQLKLEREL